MKVKGFIAVVILAAGLLAASSSLSRAEEAAFSLKAGATMRDILVENTGKKVALRLESGDEIEGTITMVGNSLVHISKLTGKEYYDSIVGIDRISAVRIRMKDK